MWPTHWLPHLCVPIDHLICWGSQPASVCMGGTCQPTQHLHMAHQQLGQVCSVNFEWWISTHSIRLNPNSICVSAGYRRGVVLAVTAVGTSKTRIVEEDPPPSLPTQPFTRPRVHQPPVFHSHTSPPCSPPWVKKYFCQRAWIGFFLLLVARLVALSHGCSMWCYLMIKNFAVNRINHQQTICHGNN